MTRKSSLLTRNRAFDDFGPIGRVTKHWHEYCLVTKPDLLSRDEGAALPILPEREWVGNLAFDAGAGVR
jgi:hypothetical protein